jgi:hypothetical protein
MTQENIAIVSEVVDTGRKQTMRSLPGIFDIPLQYRPLARGGPTVPSHRGLLKATPLFPPASPSVEHMKDLHAVDLSFFLSIKKFTKPYVP